MKRSNFSFMLVFLTAVLSLALVGCSDMIASFAPRSLEEGSGSISIAVQSATLSAGKAATATFAVSGGALLKGQAATFTYTDSAGTAVAQPAGLSLSSTNIADDGTATITVTVTNSIVAGKYYFKVTYGSVSSEVVEVTVTAAAPKNPAMLGVAQTRTQPKGLAIDSSGSSYVSGTISGNYGLSGEAVSVSPHGYLIKYDAQQEIVWEKEYTSGTSGYGSNLVSKPLVDSSGNVYLLEVRNDAADGYLYVHRYDPSGTDWPSVPVLKAVTGYMDGTHSSLALKSDGTTLVITGTAKGNLSDGTTTTWYPGIHTFVASLDTRNPAAGFKSLRYFPKDNRAQNLPKAMTIDTVSGDDAIYLLIDIYTSPFYDSTISIPLKDTTSYTRTYAMKTESLVLLRYQWKDATTIEPTPDWATYLGWSPMGGGPLGVSSFPASIALRASGGTTNAFTFFNTQEQWTDAATLTLNNAGKTNMAFIEKLSVSGSGATSLQRNSIEKTSIQHAFTASGDLHVGGSTSNSSQFGALLGNSDGFMATLDPDTLAVNAASVTHIGGSGASAGVAGFVLDGLAHYHATGTTTKPIMGGPAVVGQIDQFLYHD